MHRLDLRTVGGLEVVGHRLRGQYPVLSWAQLQKDLQTDSIIQKALAKQWSLLSVRVAVGREPGGLWAPLLRQGCSHGLCIPAGGPAGRPVVRLRQEQRGGGCAAGPAGGTGWGGCSLCEHVLAVVETELLAAVARELVPWPAAAAGRPDPLHTGLQSSAVWSLAGGAGGLLDPHVQGEPCVP